MLVVLSPAKRLDFSSKTIWKEFSQPKFLKETKILLRELKKKSPDELSELMGISEKLATENVKRYSQAKFPLTLKNAKQAIFAFQGDTYQGLNVKNFSSEDLLQSQLRLRILSGLFGVLSPMDLIFPYRLEMGTKLKVGQDKNLYEFWGNKITDYLSELGSEYLINCASEEYFSVINPKKLKQKIITPVFLNKEKGTNRKYKTIGIFAKKARGMFARFIIQEKIKTISLLKDFNLEGYIFDKSESTEDRPVFKREYKRKS